MGIQPSIDTCVLQDVMGVQVQGGLRVDMQRTISHTVSSAFR